jgi:hypothetical protein
MLKGDNMSIKNVFDEISSFSNIMSAEKNSRLGKSLAWEPLDFWENYEENIHDISQSIKCLNLPLDTYRSFYIYEPKLRKVIYADYTTKIIHRAVYDVLNPIVCKGFIADTFSCVEGRGQLKAMQRLSNWVNYVSKDDKKWYYLKLDAEKFFYRINHEVLMNIIKKKIGDKQTVKLLEHYICNASRPFGLPLGVKSPADIDDKDMLWDVGIAIGGGLSHMYGNMYLDTLDQFAKRGEGIRYYIRYMDDIIVLSHRKEELHRYKRIFAEYLHDVLRLNLNDKTAIRPISQGVEFVGYRIWPNYVRLRKSTSLRMKRRLKSIQKQYCDYEITFDKANETVMSYIALMKNCDCRALEKKIFSEFALTHGTREGDEYEGL